MNQNNTRELAAHILKTFLHEYEVTQKEVAGWIDTHPSCVNRWVHGKFLPNYETSKKILNNSTLVKYTNATKTVKKLERILCE